MVTKNVCMAYMRKNQPYNTSLANHTIHVFVIPQINMVIDKITNNKIKYL